MYKKTAEIRDIFLKFFEKKNHKILPGSSIIPKEDSSILFVNAGMNQFKNFFLGKKSVHKRIVTAQNCLRTGGKHNDLEQVGYTQYHHTFFEMLGNFSFNNYFKEEAISYAWELLTEPYGFNISPEKLWVTVHSSDIESYNIWKNLIKIPINKIIQLGKKNIISEKDENFWKMGKYGPCGLSTEIFYQHSKKLKNISLYEKFLNNQCVEIWNIVFMQFQKEKNKPLKNLKSFCVDTGMGLERISSVLQNVKSSYETDIFKILIENIINFFNIDKKNRISLRVISDHIRAAVFMIDCNIIPSNEGRGYILRRIIRRAIVHGNNIGIKNLFFYKIVNIFIKSIDNKYVTFKKTEKEIKKIIYDEEEKFHFALEKGLFILNKEIKKVRNNTLQGKILFYLYDTFGFPVEITNEICKKNNIKIDEYGFKKEMAIQKEKGRKNRDLKNNTENIFLPTINSSKFVGYKKDITTSKILFIISNGKRKKKIYYGENAYIILNKTTFFGESSGQTGDSGIIYNNTGIFKVYKTQKKEDLILHFGNVITGYIQEKNIFTTKINKKNRINISSNHTATHLLHASLRYVLGNKINQQGSWIDENHLTFDFSHNKKLSIKTLFKIEKLVNSEIQNNVSVKIKNMSLLESKKINAIASFKDKYENKVRVVKINDFSIELCGGTHVSRTGEIGTFKIVSESSVSSGIRRIEAVTRNQAIHDIQNKHLILDTIKQELQINELQLIQEIKKKINKINILEKKISELEKIEIYYLSKKLILKIISKYSFNILIYQFNKKNNNFLYNVIDFLMNKINNLIIIFSNIYDNKTFFIIKINKNITNQISAVNILKKIMSEIKGKGGGNITVAKGGIKKIIFLSQLEDKIYNWINNDLKKIN
ncbi:alanine--tRNA ligase [Buchnera aphidicola (Kurisakia onigurumii)]|uniref:alanine--tRNA ligase n=1 Tax=Buchnera aphidicola TaxID=9 RepID=UPI0031B6865D